MKKFIVGGLVLGLAMAGCASQQGAEVKTATVSAAPVAAVAMEAVEHVAERQEDCMDIRLVYPTVGNAAIDAQIEAFVKAYDARMHDEIAPICSEISEEALADGMRYSYGMWYEAIRVDADAVDLLFYLRSYTGGAHDALALETMSFDTKTGARLDPLSLIDADEAKALARLSEVSRAKLPEKLQDVDDPMSMIEAGTEPVRENFTNIVRTETGVRVYFDPYAVAPWAVGILFVDMD